MKVAVPLAKNILAPLGITAAASAIDAGIQKKIHGSGTTTLIISNEEMNDIMKIVQALEDYNILLKGVTETIKNETKEQKGGFLGTLVGTLGSILLGNLLSGKGIVRAGYSHSLSSAYTCRLWIKKIINILFPVHPLTNFEISEYYSDKSRFNNVFLRDNWPKLIKNCAYVIDLDEYKDTGTHWVALF